MADYLKATAKVPQSFSFNGFRIRPGEHFTSESPAMTRTLLAIGFAELSDGSSWNIEGRIVAETSTENLVEPATTVAPSKRGRPKGYKRRDMRAEG